MNILLSLPCFLGLSNEQAADGSIEWGRSSQRV